MFQGTMAMFFQMNTNKNYINIYISLTQYTTNRKYYFDYQYYEQSPDSAVT